MPSKKSAWPAGHKKLVNFFIHACRSESFLVDVVKIRKQFGVNTDGLPEPRTAVGTFVFPGALKLTKERESEFLKLMTWLAQKHKMGVVQNFRIPLAYFVLYNAIYLPEYYDLCAIENHTNDQYSKNRYGEENLFSNITHPVSIRISPTASQRDIIDYVSKNYSKHIHPLQILHKGAPTQIAKKRTRVNRNVEMGDFIWEHKHLSAEDLKDAFNKKFGTALAYNEVTRMKSSELKKRK